MFLFQHYNILVIYKKNLDHSIRNKKYSLPISVVDLSKNQSNILAERMFHDKTCLKIYSAYRII